MTSFLDKTIGEEYFRRPVNHRSNALLVGLYRLVVCLMIRSKSRRPNVSRAGRLLRVIELSANQTFVGRAAELRKQNPLPVSLLLTLSVILFQHARQNLLAARPQRTNHGHCILFATHIVQPPSAALSQHLRPAGHWRGRGG